MKKKVLGIIMLVAGMVFAVQAEDVFRKLNIITLDASGSFTNAAGPKIPGTNDVAVWNAAFANAAQASVALAANGSWQGIRLGSSLNRAVTIATNGITQTTLSLGASGIDMSQAANTLTIVPNVVLGASQTWNVTNTLTINGVVSGESSSALTKNGAGILLFSTTNTYSGGTILNNGTLRLGSVGALGSGTLTLNDGTTLASSSGAGRLPTNHVLIAGNVTLGDSVGVGKLTFSGGGVDLGGGVRTLMTASGVEMNGGGITNGGIIKNGTNTLTLASTTNDVQNTFSGGVTLNQGTLALELTSTNTLGSGTLTLNGGTLALATASGRNYGRNTTVGGDVTITGTGTNAANNITLTLGTLDISSHTMNVVAGTTAVFGVTFGATTINGASVFNVTTNIAGAQLTLGALNGTGGSITKNGGGTLTLADTAGTFDGNITVSFGTLIGAATNAFGTSNITVAGGATLMLSNAVTIADSANLTLNPTSILNLNFTGADTVGGISLDGGTTWLAPGTYSASDLVTAGLAGAAGTGSLTVAGGGPASYTLTGSVTGGNGTVSPTNALVTVGGSTNFVITADLYYRIASLITNGTAVTGMTFDNGSTVTNFIWSNVQTDGTLVASFTAQLAADPAGTPYSWLAGHGLTNYDADAVADQDLDGLKTWQEYIAGTDPTNKASCLRAVETPRNVVSWSAVAGKVYSVYWSTNLVSGFTSLATGILPPQNSYTNAAPSTRANFYQVRVHVQP